MSLYVYTKSIKGRQAYNISLNIVWYYAELFSHLMELDLILPIIIVKVKMCIYKKVNYLFILQVKKSAI